MEVDLSAYSRPAGLYVLDAHTLEQRAHLNPGEWTTLLGFTPDGGRALISRAGRTEAGRAFSDLQLLDLASLEVVASGQAGALWWRHPPAIFVALERTP
jgi:hypothetical protein